jgi:NAD(P) transhydrogenase subunit alpha
MFPRTWARWAATTLAVLLTLLLTQARPADADVALPAAGPALASATASFAVPTAAAALAVQEPTVAAAQQEPAAEAEHPVETPDYWSLIFVFVLSSFIGLGVIRRVSRLLHTPLMSITNAISAIAVIGAILVTGPEYPQGIRIMGAIALFASVTNIVSGFLITDRMLKMFKTDKAH